MKKIKHIGLSLVLLLCLSFVACERSYDSPKPYKVYADTDFALGEIVPISTVKQLYYDAYPATTIGEGVEIMKGYVIKGKVISIDREGNIYRTMYIQDDSGAIEVKLGITSSYNYFKPGQTIYVICKGLVLGNYRYMLSLGFSAKNYPNGYIDVKVAFGNLRENGGIILQGENTGFVSADTTVVRSAAELNDNLLGRLVRLEGVTHTHGMFDNDEYPNFLEQKDDAEGKPQYINYVYTKVINDWNQYQADSIKWVNGSGPRPSVPASPKPENMAGPTYAFRNTTLALNYYGSALMKFGASTTDPTQNLIARSSGYSRFANTLLPPSGQKLNVTAIYTKFSASSGGFIKYQLQLNSSSDVVAVN